MRCGFYGKSVNSIYGWYTGDRFWLLLIVICLLEDFTNNNSPRRNLYKNRLGIPDLHDYLMFEIVNVKRGQLKSSDEERESKLEMKARQDRESQQNSESASAVFDGDLEREDQLDQEHP